MSDLFAVNSDGELRALQRIFLEAILASDPNDGDILASPLVNDMYSRILDSLDQNKIGSGWNTWIQSKKTEFMHVTKNRLMKIQSWEWQKWSEEEKRSYISDCLYPILDIELDVEDLLQLANQKHQLG